MIVDLKNFETITKNNKIIFERLRLITTENNSKKIKPKNEKNYEKSISKEKSMINAENFFQINEIQSNINFIEKMKNKNFEQITKKQNEKIQIFDRFNNEIHHKREINEIQSFNQNKSMNLDSENIRHVISHQITDHAKFNPFRDRYFFPREKSNYSSNNSYFKPIPKQKTQIYSSEFNKVPEQNYLLKNYHHRQIETSTSLKFNKNSEVCYFCNNDGFCQKFFH